MKLKMMMGLAVALSLAMPMSAAPAEDMPVAVDEPLALADIEMEVPVDIPAGEVSDGTESAPAEDGPNETTLRAQQLLIDMGLLEGVADGKFGPMTAEAVAAFQAQSGLDQTGALDAVTLERLQNVSRSNGSVTAVQQRLIELGYLAGEADGKFGARSAEALKLFQQFHSLNATGLIDSQTLERLFSDDALSIHGPLIPGDKGQAVVEMQERLIQYGFTDAEADGAYGKKTIAAVSAFQQHLLDQGLGQRYALAVDGNASVITQFFLFSDGYSTYLRDVTPGAQGPEALRVERRLHTLGYMDKAPDDTLDDYAAQALALFVEKAGLSDGSGADRTVIDALFSQNAPVADHCVPHDIAAGDTGLSVKNVQEALVRGGMLVKIPDGKYGSDLEEAVEQLHAYLQKTGSSRAALFADSGALSVAAQEALQGDLLGYRSDVDDSASETEVLRVQRRLHTLYYLARTGVDGNFGENSKQAVSDFQADNGLPQTGVADAATQALMFSTDATAKALPYRVEVSLDRQRVYVYERDDDGRYHHVQTFVCSTGLGNSTPRGIFLDGFPVNRWHYFEKFHCWAQYSFDVEGDIMFHSVLDSSSSESSLRSGSVYALGSKASHGCIRLKVADARWLFEHCPRGSLAILIY